MKVLLTWVGNHDPLWTNNDGTPYLNKDGKPEMGPILLLQSFCPFDLIYIFYNPCSRTDDFVKRTVELTALCAKYFPKLKVVQKLVDLISVTDYQEVYEKTNNVCQDILREKGQADREYFVYLSPGTPQMQTVWILLVQSGLLPAKMLIGTHRRDREEGAPIYREVNLSTRDLPQIVSPDKTARVVSLLETENRNLKARTEELDRRLDVLHAEVERLQAGSGLSTLEEQFPPNFSLKIYLSTVEKELYLRAYEQAGGKVPEAARLLGVQQHTFRERAQKLSIRERRHAAGEGD